MYQVVDTNYRYPAVTDDGAWARPTGRGPDRERDLSFQRPDSRA